MNLTVLTYLLYLVTAVPITIWVARSLFRNGRVFLIDVFHGREDLANSVNALLVVGFYLLNLGFVALYLRVGSPVADGRDVIEALSAKLGIVLIVLAVVHLTNVWVFNRLRRRSLVDRERRAPIGPQGVLPQPAGMPPQFARGPATPSAGPQHRPGPSLPPMAPPANPTRPHPGPDLPPPPR